MPVETNGEAKSISAALLDGPAAGEVLDLISVGLILVMPSTEIIAANGAAATYLEHRDGLYQENGLLMTEGAADGAQLRRMILESAETGAPGAMLVRRSREVRPLTLLARAYGAPGRRRILLALRENGAKTASAVERVRTLFRLAPAEADIAVQLSMGADLPEIAAARGVTINTIRTQVASAMIKVGVRRQAELVAAISGIDILI